MMKTIKNTNADDQTTTKERQQNVNVPSDEIKLSNQAVPFRNPKAGDQPCMSFMSPVQSDMQRVTHTAQGSGQPAANDKLPKKGCNPIIDADKHFKSEALVTARGEAIRDLNFLIKFDDGLTMAGRQILHTAVSVINNAGAF